MPLEAHPRCESPTSMENAGQPVCVDKSENLKNRLLKKVKLDGCGLMPLIPALGLGKAEGSLSCRQLVYTASLKK